MGVAFEIITKGGSHFSYGEEKLGQGKENAKKYLREHPEVTNEIDAKIREKVLKSAVPLELSEPENFDDAEDFEDDKES